MTPNVNWSPVATQAAMQAAQRFNNNQRKGRILPRISPSILEMALASAVHVFNVGPWEEVVPLGSWGSFFIPACPRDMTYVRVVSGLLPPGSGTFPGIFHEPQPGDGKFSYDEVEGSFMATELMAEGQGYSDSQSRRHTGLFIGSVRGPKGNDPNEQEIARANDFLDAECERLMNEASAAKMAGGMAEFEIIGTRHRIAAARLNRLDVPWMKDRSTLKMVNCDNCGTANQSGIAQCRCGCIVDVRRYNELVAQGRIPNGRTVADPAAEAPIDLGQVDLGQVFTKHDRKAKE